MNKKKARLIFYPFLFLVLVITVIFYDRLEAIYDKAAKKHTVSSRLIELESKVDQVLVPIFREKQVRYPPAYSALVFLKDEKTLHLYGGDSANTLKRIKSYPVRAASGHSGPKLAEGDRQVPEGVYRVESLNPNSLFHLALRVGFPNGDDKKFADMDGRQKLGSDIMIHGSNVSVGCIAIGDSAIEEIFVLAAKTDYSKWALILAPTDLRMNPQPDAGNIKWLPVLYGKISEAMKVLE